VPVHALVTDVCGISFAIRELSHMRVFLSCVLVLSTVTSTISWQTPCRAETWADRLGYPPQTKVLLLHLNELGMCYESNAAITSLLQDGPARSASAMAPCPWFADAAAWCTEHSGADVGLELTVTSEFETYRWRSVAGDALVATLLDPDRFFWRTPTQVMVNAAAEDVEHELLAQIEYAKSIGLRPSHLTTHLGALVTRPDLIELYLRVARQQWIPAVVVELTPPQLEQFRSAGYPLPDEIVQLFRDYPLPKLDDLRMVPPADSFAAKKEAFLKQLADVSPGLTQIAMLPALESGAIQRITPTWQQRVWDAQLLADSDVKSALQAEGIVITDWREVMSRFDGQAPASEQMKNE
jgi:predicted glycoside hydrolase/deacetylase ChbG (UPF0249 family)